MEVMDIVEIKEIKKIKEAKDIVEIKVIKLIMEIMDSEIKENVEIKMEMILTKMIKTKNMVTNQIRLVKLI